MGDPAYRLNDRLYVALGNDHLADPEREGPVDGAVGRVLADQDDPDVGIAEGQGRDEHQDRLQLVPRSDDQDGRAAGVGQGARRGLQGGDDAGPAANAGRDALGVRAVGLADDRHHRISSPGTSVRHRTDSRQRANG